MPDPTKTPDASFLNFLSGLSAQALMQFGDIPNPITGSRDANPAYAKYTVDLLHILAEKTKGNLSKEEDEYLQTMLKNFRDKLARLG
jgi:Domain of unknown function (DUF1844)